MSYYTFIASNDPLEDVENPYIKLLSINDALGQGIPVPELVLNASNADRDKPGVLLWVEDEDMLGEITIHAIEKGTFPENIPTHLKYCSSLEWRYSEKRAKQLISYIKKHLEISDIVEILCIWLGIDQYKVTEEICICINNLMPSDFESTFNSTEVHGFRLSITRG